MSALDMDPLALVAACAAQLGVTAEVVEVEWWEDPATGNGERRCTVTLSTEAGRQAENTVVAPDHYRRPDGTVGPVTELGLARDVDGSWVNDVATYIAGQDTPPTDGGTP